MNELNFKKEQWEILDDKNTSPQVKESEEHKKNEPHSAIVPVERQNNQQPFLRINNN